jgi:hypothetical protein
MRSPLKILKHLKYRREVRRGFTESLLVPRIDRGSEFSLVLLVIFSILA